MGFSLPPSLLLENRAAHYKNNKKVLHGCQTQGVWVLHDCQTQGVWDCHVCHIQVTWVWHIIKPKIPELDANCVQSYWTWWAVKFKVMWVRHACRSKCLASQAYKHLGWLFLYIYFLIFKKIMHYLYIFFQINFWFMF